ncbi:membrane protease subunit (stomatin/prohibitin family) [Conyzicola lurida]|uniref:Membrane protease subunit (Stomatin/prohibitin family) n=1 Tax=Conyzicola lurida TaxID=1172621 RepID=A0A841AJN1_9MICO|nr:SHOCT domain-containing protein [Conyzicola lurida]MBB5842634.1 membrane protease subunit (stomatin/prohibitin family) [Conyzicola lurida]
MPLFRRVGRPGLLGLAARTAVVAGTATAVSGGMRRHQQQRATEQWEQQQYEAEQQQAAAPAAASIAPGTAGVDLVGELQKLESLHAAGALSDQEFAAAKAKLLG